MTSCCTQYVICTRLRYGSATLCRSLCTLVCKWTYCPPEGWDASFWTCIGLEDLLENNCSKIGKRQLQTSFPETEQNIRVTFFKHLISCLSRAALCHPGRVTCPPGSPLGDGLTQEAAADLGLDPGTAVGASLIDAHAGGLGITSKSF